MAKTSGTKKSRENNGFTQIQNFIFSDKNLNSYDRMVLIVLKKHQFKDEYCYPGIPLIAKEAGCSPHTVIRSLKKMSALGYIYWYKTGRHNNYKVDWEELKRTTIDSNAQ